MTRSCASLRTYRFEYWLDAVPSHEGTGAECAPISERDILETLYVAAGGPNWTQSDNWLTDAPLGLWHGVTTGSDGRVTEMDLRVNNLVGAIPAELGGLASLRHLNLSVNNLTGVIPAELGGLASLRSLHLRNNGLTGPIPPELGGPASLKWLSLGNNGLTGPIPPELGNLTSLMDLFLDYNDLTGGIPVELGGLIRLSRFVLTGNADMSGELPTNLTKLGRLVELNAGGTDLCAPGDASFRDWLESVHTRRISWCEETDSKATAYMTQAVQSREFPVPLVAGDPALLRVFVTAEGAGGARIPPVRARLYAGGSEIHEVNVPGRSATIPAEILEGALSASANVEISGDFVQSGLELVIEVDPGRTLDPALGVPRRIPEMGRMAINVRAMPVLNLTLVPFLWETKPDSSVLDLASAMAQDPMGHELLWDTRTLLSVGGITVMAHAPVLSSSNSAFALFRQTEVIRVMEDGGGHYMGMLAGPVTGAIGVATVPGRSSFSVPGASTIAHELGHNMRLWHAPCGGALGPDPWFPHARGSIGAWGYDFRDGGRLVSPFTPDLMSYCGPEWTSEYHFANALRFRLFDEGSSEEQAVVAAAPALLLWGGANAEGVPYLEPAFVIDAPPALPDSIGEHQITGTTAAGDVLFSLSFGMLQMADGDGRSSFVFAVPARPEWADRLDAIVLSGPGGSVALDGGSDRPTVILQDPGTGQVRAFLSGAREPILAQATAHAIESGLDVLFSRGIPDAAAWR